MNKDQALSSPGCSPVCPGWSSAGRGQQLGGRSQPRAARRRPARGDIRFECGATDSHSSLPVPDPAATVNLERSCGEWLCAGWGSLRRAPAPLPAEGEQRAPLGLREKRDPKVWTVPGRGWEGIFAPAAALLLHPRRGPLCAPGVALQVRGFSRLHRAPNSRRRVSAGPLGGPASPPTARLPGPRPAAAPGQGAPPADADPACVIPVAPAEPRAAAAARIRAPAVEDRGSGVGGGRLWGRGAGAPGALDRGRRASRRAARAAGFM